MGFRKRCDLCTLKCREIFWRKRAREVIKLREENGGAFTDISQLKKIPRKILNQRALKLLYYASAFRGISGDIGDIIDAYADLPVLGE